MVGFVFVARRPGLGRAFVLAAVLLISPVKARYALCHLAVLGFVLLLDRAARRSPGGVLEAAVVSGDRSVRLAGVVLAAATWVRPEYVVLLVLWAAYCPWLKASPRAVVRAVAPGIVVAGAPYAAIALAGGLSDLTRSFGYLLRYKEYRGLPIDWAFPVRAAADVLSWEARDGAPCCSCPTGLPPVWRSSGGLGVCFRACDCSDPIRPGRPACSRQ